MALEGALEALGPAPQPSGYAGMRAQMGTLPAEKPLTGDDLAELDRELARKDLTPQARATLQDYRNSAPKVADSGPLSGALRALDADGSTSVKGTTAPPEQAKTGTWAETAESLPGVSRALVGAGETALNWATGTLGTAYGGWRQMLGTALGEENLPDARDTAAGMTYEPRTSMGKTIAGIPGRAMEATGKVINKAGNAVSGGNVPDIGTMITHPGQLFGEALGKTGESIENAVPALRGRVAPVMAAAGAAAPVLVAGGAKAIESAGKSALSGPRGAAVREFVTGRPTSPTDAGRISQATQSERAALDSGRGAQPESGPSRELAGGGAAVTNANPYPILTGEEAARGQYPVVKLSKTPQDVPVAEQEVRATIMNQLGLGRGREGVIKGNEDILRNEQAEARAPSPTVRGALLKQQIAGEQQALSNYAQQRVEATGANPHFVDDYQRGEFVNNVMTGPDGLTGHLNELKQQVYATAAQATQGRPIATTHLDALLNNKQFQAELRLKGVGDFTGGMGDLVNVFKSEGFEGAAPNSIAAAEKLRQSLNRQWTPQNKYFIGRVIEALDNDVASAGGPGLFEQARAIHGAEKALFNSPGIKTLFGDIDPNGVQTATAYEQIPKKLNNMPYDQWRHVYETADSLANGRMPGNHNIVIPDELRAGAAQMRNEMAGSLAREVHQAGADKAGVWNQNSANKILNARARKIARAFPPQEQRAFHTLNIGGQMMPGTHSYEGAGLQTSRLNQMGLMERHAPAAGALIGEATHIPGASWVGEKIGERMQGAFGAKRQMREARKLDAQMEANIKRGKRLSDLMSGKE